MGTLVPTLANPLVICLLCCEQGSRVEPPNGSSIEVVFGFAPNNADKILVELVRPLVIEAVMCMRVDDDAHRDAPLLQRGGEMLAGQGPGHLVGPAQQHEHWRRREEPARMSK